MKSHESIYQFNVSFHGKKNIIIKKKYWIFCISDTVAFHTVLTSYNTIIPESAVLFNEVLLNEGDGQVDCINQHVHFLCSFFLFWIRHNYKFCMTSNIILPLVIRYDSTTGTFTVPPGGDGYYYFSTYLVVDDDETGLFNIELNGELICSAYGDQTDTVNNDENTSCNAAVYVTEGAS